MRVNPLLKVVPNKWPVPPYLWVFFLIIIDFLVNLFREFFLVASSFIYFFMYTLKKKNSSDKADISDL